MTAQAKVAVRVCECCKAWFGRKRSPSGRLEDASQFADRRFCSRVCYRKAAAEGRRLRPVGRWITQPRALNGARATVSDPILGAGTTFPNQHSRIATAPGGTPERVRAADSVPRLNGKR